MLIEHELYVGRHINKWAKLNFSHAIMTLMSKDIRVIINEIRQIYMGDGV